jgi:hypothetical protein
MTTHPTDDDIDLRPMLGVIARSWARIHPLDLTADEVFSLLTLLMQIENRLDDDSDQGDRPTLRLVRDAVRVSE